MHILQFTSTKTIGHTMGCVKERNVKLTVQVIIVSSRCRKERLVGYLPAFFFKLYLIFNNNKPKILNIHFV
jgi:hypothetical protein